jgi:hypothetical protein
MINISIEYDWEAAKADVTDYVLDKFTGRTLRYKNEDEAAALAYLSTQYFDVNGMRYNQLDTYAVQTPEKAYDFMRNLMAVWLAQKEVYDEITANDAFEQFKVGNHDT